MKTKFQLAILAFAILTSVAWAAGPIPDTINVTFPFPVIVNNMTLPPGSYQFVRDSDLIPTTFRIYDSNGKLLGMTTLARREQYGTDASNEVPDKDYVVVDEIDGKHYLDTMYLAGEKRAFRFQQADALQSQIERAAKENKGQQIAIVVSRR